MTETFTLTLEQAHAYEDLFVPALFAQWVPPLLEIAGVAPGGRVLDVACGTGVVARAAARLVGPAGRVSGVDLNPAMIQVAREVDPALDWRVGDAQALPYGEDSFDAVVCQSALFFFPDPRAALAEMARVLAPGGRVALQTYASLDEQPGYGPFVDVVAAHTGPEARSLLGTYWSRGDADELRRWLVDAGLASPETRSLAGTVRFPTIAALVDTEVGATPLAHRIDDAARRAIVDDAAAVLAPFADGTGGVTLPIVAVLATARRPRDGGADRQVSP